MTEKAQPVGELEEDARTLNAQQKRNLAMLERLRAGASFRVVGADYGLSSERARQIARQMGYSGRQSSPRWLPDADHRLQDLATAGFSAALIAEQLGTTKDAVAGRAHRLGIVLSGRMRRVAVYAPRICVACGSIYAAKTSKGRYCSAACQQRAWRQRRAECA